MARPSPPGTGASCAQKGHVTEMSTDYAATARRLYDLINAGDIEGFGRLLADDFVEHEVTPGLAPTKDGVLEFFRIQRAAFPDIESLEYEIPAVVSYEAALSVIVKRGWHVVDSRPPAAGGRAGTIEAVARTLIMGFRDDVVVRVRALGRGSRVDVRSASRYGTHDFGANARRVASLLQDIDDVVSSLPATELEKQPLPAAQPGRR